MSQLDSLTLSRSSWPGVRYNRLLILSIIILLFVIKAHTPVDMKLKMFGGVAKSACLLLAVSCLGVRFIDEDLTALFPVIIERLRN